MAVRFGDDAALLARVSRSFARAVMASLRRRTARHHEVGTAAGLHAGVLVVVQRFRYDLGLFVHLHALATDGAFAHHGSVTDDGAAVRWLAAPAATEHDLRAVLAAVHRRLGRVDDDVDIDVDPTIAACVQLSHAGLGRPVAPSPPRTLEVSAFSISLHAASVIDGRDSKRLKRMLRYMLRPPFAHDAIHALADGRVRIAFKTPTRSGATHVDVEPDRFGRPLDRAGAAAASASGAVLRCLLEPSRTASADPGRAWLPDCGPAHAGPAVRSDGPARVAQRGIAARDR